MPHRSHALPLRPLALAVAAVVSLPLCAAEPAQPEADAASTAVAAALPPQQMSAITVVASGETRQVQRIGERELEAATPGTSPLKVLDQLPGVQFQAADPWGNYEWATQITLHGFDQSRLGFTLDGIPLGNMGYGVSNGLHASRAIITENVASVELAQGAGALGTASNSNLGGTIQYFSDDPGMDPGVRVAQTFGSDDTRRTFARLDTGDHGGFSAYLAGVDGSTDKWKGFDDQAYQQVNLKGVYAWGDSRLSLYVDTSRRREYDYMDLSLTSQRELGWEWDYLIPDWEMALQIADALAGNGTYPEELDGLPEGYSKADAAYYLGGGIRNDDLAALAGSFALADGIALDTTAYYHGNRGEGLWVTPYTPSPNGVPLSMRTTDYGLDRYGGLAALKLDLGMHRIELGTWLENYDNDQQRNFFGLDADGFTDLFNFYSSYEPFLRGFYQHYEVKTRMAYVQDSMRFLGDRLGVTVGAKALETTTEATSRVASGSNAQGRIEASDHFLPQAGVNWRLGGGQEIYASVAQNQANYGYTPFGQAQASFDATVDALEPEASTTYQFGYRVQGAAYEISADLYRTDFDNRLLSISPCSAIQTCASIISNVGSVRSQGVDLALLWRPVEGLRWLNSLSYNDITYQDDYVSGGEVVATEGKRVVGIPEWMFSSTASWTVGAWRASLDGKYVGERELSYLNDSHTPSYWLVDAGLDYDFGRIGAIDDLRVGLNVTNLGDKRYFSSTGTAGYQVSDPDGFNQTLMVGAPRQAFLSVDARF
ncbi:TonB-dependent receptor [Coralloluteibacterium stylophorae]|uniref:TonB-dependent receptor n=1 Tax=Coralloluteibacterium stylophorae TaxID=1776034 RepID=A0A8J7VSY4_9GAMM|nr:TonB-dependent receptor [Coralloluteibacterium stylophorae]MBS7456936.1 TonB-dependent receptor [Coralloluteibacterium stylophorae]